MQRNQTDETFNYLAAFYYYVVCNRSYTGTARVTYPNIAGPRALEEKQYGCIISSSQVVRYCALRIGV